MRASCTICARPAHAKGLCKWHYERKANGIPFDRPKKAAVGARAPCSVDGCVLRSQAKGLCKRHYQRSWNGRALVGVFQRDPKNCERCGARTRKAKWCAPCGTLAAAEAHKRSGWARRARYGISPEGFAAILESQGNRCAICCTERPGGLGWHLDHDHSKDPKDKSGHRGVLCCACNVGLGNFGDNARRLEEAVGYLSRYRQGVRLVCV